MPLGLVEIALCAASLSVSACLLIVASQRWHGKHTLDHDLDGVQKFHTTAVPRIGGIAIVAAVFATLLLGTLITPVWFPHRIFARASSLVLAGMPAFLAGTIEDVTKKVSVRTRLAAAIISALLASWFLGAIVDGLDVWGLDNLLAWTPFALLVTALTVAGGVNAINIIDGFNGLAASTVMVMLTALAVLGWQVGDLFVAKLAIVTLGATAGFLLVNYPKGKLFLGDGGAYFLGFWVSEMVVLLLVRNTSVNAWQVLSICAYPLIEVMFSIYRRKILREVSPGAPDGLHLHTLIYRRFVSRLFQRDLARPWKRNAAVAFFVVPWVASAAFISVSFGQTIPASIMIVGVQILVYLSFYARLIRGRWLPRKLLSSGVCEEIKAEA